ncbi:MAG: hypothetical protein JNM32_03585 [Dechloromonas sp.]|jgi:outer membrane protein assembly factor BamE (lipoprotein component of BamABCDE complex)|nr:hypothetical protein [Dechloromonas sp.]
MKTPPWLATAAAAIIGTLLPACDALNLQELKLGVSTSSEVRARMGNPSAEFLNDDGTVTWEYNRQPNGIECPMLSFDANGVLVRIEQALSAENQARVRPGMSQDEIRRLLGKPGKVEVFHNLQEEIWDWRVAGTMATEEAHFHVHFNLGDGRVKTTSRRIQTYN